MGISEKRIPGGAEKIQMSLSTIRKKKKSKEAIVAGGK